MHVSSKIWPAEFVEMNGGPHSRINTTSWASRSTTSNEWHASIHRLISKNPSTTTGNGCLLCFQVLWRYHTRIKLCQSWVCHACSLGSEVAKVAQRAWGKYSPRNKCSWSEYPSFRDCQTKVSASNSGGNEHIVLGKGEKQKDCDRGGCKNCYQTSSSRCK